VPEGGFNRVAIDMAQTLVARLLAEFSLSS
jgi:hypothetical protein